MKVLFVFLGYKKRTGAGFCRLDRLGVRHSSVGDVDGINRGVLFLFCVSQNQEHADGNSHEADHDKHRKRTGWALSLIFR